MLPGQNTPQGRSLLAKARGRRWGIAELKNPKREQLFNGLGKTAVSGAAWPASKQGTRTAFKLNKKISLLGLTVGRPGTGFVAPAPETPQEFLAHNAILSNTGERTSLG